MNNKIIKAFRLIETDESTITKFYNFLREKYPEFELDGYELDDLTWGEWTTTDVIFLEETYDFGRTQKWITWTPDSVYEEYENRVEVEPYGKSIFREKRLNQIL